MRVLIAPDKLKGSLTAAGAAAAMARGVERAGGGSSELLPLADGGEGTLEAVLGALGGDVHGVGVHDALGDPCQARLGILPGGRVALIESADAIGLARLGSGVRRALDSTSLVALGGSATNDGGIGAAQALGAVLTGIATPARSRDLPAVDTLDLSALDARLAHVELIALCDVDSPLTGPTGASQLFGAQKGLGPADAARLDQALAALAARFSLDSAAAGMGAAGGLGFGLAAFAGAKRVSGADWVLDAMRFDERARQSDLVLTAEGRLDAQSLAGKLVVRVGERAARVGTPAAALAGSVEVSEAQLAAHGLLAAFALGDGRVSEAESMARVAELLEAAAERAVNAFCSGTARARRSRKAPS